MPALIPFKLYIVIAARLASGLKIAQACHALRSFTAEHPVIDQFWHQESNNIVCLETDSIDELADSLESDGLRISRFHEPDLDGSLTVIAVEPNGWRRLSSLRLAK